MGNGIGTGRKKAKVMKIDGQTFKVKTPIRAADVMKDYPQGYVLLDSEAVKHFGIRAKPLEPQQELKPKKTYFLVELPKLPEEDNDKKIPIRRVRSGVQMSAKDRLDLLMLSRRTVSDVALVNKPTSSFRVDEGGGNRSMSVKVKLTKSQMAKLVEESRDEKEVVEKIMELHGHGNIASGKGALLTHQTHRNVLPPKEKCQPQVFGIQKTRKAMSSWRYHESIHMIEHFPWSYKLKEMTISEKSRSTYGSVQWNKEKSNK